MSTAVVSNLNLIVESKEIIVLVEKFNTFARKTAEGVLEMSKVICEAKKLKDSEFYKFCELVGMSGSSSTVQKLIKIGEKYEYFVRQIQSVGLFLGPINQPKMTKNDQYDKMTKNDKNTN
jgi:hypothetical protein